MPTLASGNVQPGAFVNVLPDTVYLVIVESEVAVVRPAAVLVVAVVISAVAASGNVMPTMSVDTPGGVNFAPRTLVAKL